MIARSQCLQMQVSSGSRSVCHISVKKKTPHDPMPCSTRVSAEVGWAGRASGHCIVCWLALVTWWAASITWFPIRSRALQPHILRFRKLLPAVHVQRPGWWSPGQPPLKKKTLEPAEIATISASTAVRTDGVDEKPSGGKNKCRTVHVDTSMKVSFLDMRCEVRDTLKWSLQNRLSEVRRLCPGFFDELEASAPHREKRSAATTVKLGRPRLLSAAEMAKLLGTSCMSCVRVQARAEPGARVRVRTGSLSEPWGMNFSYRMPALRVQNLHLFEPQDANT